MKKFLNSFNKVDQDQDELVSCMIGQDQDTSFIKIFKKELGFLNNYNLVEALVGNTLPPKSYKAIISDDMKNVYPQNGNQNQFYQITKLKGFNLSEEIICNYVRSFFYCAYGTAGKLVLVEAVDDIEWRDVPAPSLLTMVRDEVSTLNIVTAQSAFLLEGYFISNDALVKAKININEDGKISIEDLEIIFDTIPVKTVSIDN